jgi:predicted AAA+ superfamily ATPase
MANGGTSPYRTRLVDPLLDELLAQLSALMVIGPRAAGKTTTCSRRAATTVRLDRAAEAAAFEADPDAALRDLPEPVLLDEWQAVPGVLAAVKRAVDAEPRPARFILTGSVRAELENEMWPGTGRLVRQAMFPMTIREQLGRGDGPDFFERLGDSGGLTVDADPPDLRSYVEMALRGGFPDPALRLSGRPRQAWLESYIEDLLTHDVEALEEGRRDAQRLRRYFEAYALNSAGVTDHRTIYEAAGVNKVTAVAYESLLHSLLVADAVPAWRSNRLKRLIHLPKRYLVDPALITAALRIDEQGAMRDGDMLGRILETFVAAQLRAEIAASPGQPRLHHLRTEQGRHEIDLLVELAGERLIGIEVKATASPGVGDAKHLTWLREELGERFVAGLVLHTGPGLFELGERIVAAPICALWGSG